MNRYKNTLTQSIVAIVLFSIIRFCNYMLGFENTLYFIATLIIVSIWNLSNKNK